MDRRNPILALVVCVLATYLLSEPCGAEDAQICVDQNTLFLKTIISPGVIRPACASAISPNALDAHPYQICMKTGPRKISDRSGMFHGLCVCAWSSVDDVDWESLLADLRCAGCFRWEISVPQNGPFALGGMLCLPGP